MTATGTSTAATPALNPFWPSSAHSNAWAEPTNGAPPAPRAAWAASVMPAASCCTGVGSSATRMEAPVATCSKPLKRVAAV